MTICDRCQEPAEHRGAGMCDNILMKVPHEQLQYDLCDKCYVLITAAVDMIVNCPTLELKFDKTRVEKV